MLKTIRSVLILGLCGAAPVTFANAPDAGAGAIETGKAAFYSKVFDGHKTASRERYRANAMVTAHKTHPFGTKLRVTNLKNDKSVIVRVIDRGPSAPDRILDVSRRAAKELGFLRDGMAEVKVEVVQ